MSINSTREKAPKRTKQKWQETKTRDELLGTLGWDRPPKTTISHKFSAHHPMLPGRYVPAWQSDMKNRKLILQNCKLAGNPCWKGHTSYFLCGRERLSATRYDVYESIANYSRNLKGNASHLSKFNSSMLLMA